MAIWGRLPYPPKVWSRVRDRNEDSAAAARRNQPADGRTSLGAWKADHLTVYETLGGKYRALATIPLGGERLGAIAKHPHRPFCDNGPPPRLPT